jgi:hypothetical protein
VQFSNFNGNRADSCTSVRQPQYFGYVSEISSSGKTNEEGFIQEEEIEMSGCGSGEEKWRSKLQLPSRKSRSMSKLETLYTNHPTMFQYSYPRKSHTKDGNQEDDVDLRIGSHVVRDIRISYLEITVHDILT